MWIAPKSGKRCKFPRGCKCRWAQVGLFPLFLTSLPSLPASLAAVADAETGWGLFPPLPVAAWERCCREGGCVGSGKVWGSSQAGRCWRCVPAPVPGAVRWRDVSLPGPNGCMFWDSAGDLPICINMHELQVSWARYFFVLITLI